MLFTLGVGLILGTDAYFFVGRIDLITLVAKVIIVTKGRLRRIAQSIYVNLSQKDLQMPITFYSVC